MKLIKLLLLTTTLTSTTSLIAQYKLENNKKTIETIIEKDGSISGLTFKNNFINNVPIQFRNDSLKGPALIFNNKTLTLKQIDQTTYQGSTDQLNYQIKYVVENDRLGINIKVKNTSKQAISPENLSLRLGMSTEMLKYPNWRDEYFPTLMRSEKTHFWGYFMSPNGRIITLSSPNPIASYKLHYNNSKLFGHGHLIRTVSLDLLHKGPLPERHPKNLNSIASNKEMSWTIYLEEAKNLTDVKTIVTRNTSAPTIDASLYSIRPNEVTKLTINSVSKPKIVIVEPDGKKVSISKLHKNSNDYNYDLTSTKPGVHTILVEDSTTKKVSEAKITVLNNDYADYIKSARRAAIIYPQQASSHTESWYGFFSAYIAREKFPDAEWDKKVDAKFDEIYPLIYDPITNLPTYFGSRIQNHALMAALFAQRYKATKDIEELNKAADLADYIMAMQSPDGAYRNGKTHYTSVIYIAKALMEVMEQEKILAENNDYWKMKYKKHYHSVKKAIDELTKNLDNIQTEGEMTFEDGMISCSYTQISQFALLQPENSPERKKYTEAAEKLVEMHRCLSQLLIPDSRMNGGSMRYWEAQYDILSGPNMMNSPHGWSAWRIYGLKNLYELTGKPEYLNQMINAINTCIQLLNPETDKLNWAFIVDPYIEANIFTEDKQNKGKGIYQKEIIGEQYMPMISDWNKPAPNTRVTGYWGYDGGKCDNDVHEIFKCLNEVLLSYAYVIEQNGEYIGYNCKVEKTKNGITIIPNENVIDKLHFNLKNPIQITFKNKTNQVNSKLGWF
ncbi:hypothetical protein [Empedobacter sp. UBA7248]|uniref:hypothetical protein n=1 Tax=Empedobacter sp. UBA7248 TaxID=1946448 RepID=UPI0025C58EDF|nr:hypothetical protein [Empedobacter sp. UBA7248]